MERILVTIGNDQPVLVRVSRINGRWLASADTPRGPTLGLGWDRLAAIYLALDPFQPAVDAVLDALPPAAPAGERG